MSTTVELKENKYTYLYLYMVSFPPSKWSQSLLVSVHSCVVKVNRCACNAPYILLPMRRGQICLRYSVTVSSVSTFLLLSYCQSKTELWHFYLGHIIWSRLELVTHYLSDVSIITSLSIIFHFRINLLSFYFFNFVSMTHLLAILHKYIRINT